MKLNSVAAIFTSAATLFTFQEGEYLHAFAHRTIGSVPMPTAQTAFHDTLKGDVDHDIALCLFAGTDAFLAGLLAARGLASLVDDSLPFQKYFILCDYFLHLWRWRGAQVRRDVAATP